jgi:hypothetical protein
MLAVRRPGYGARSVERDDPAHANMREMWGCGGQWARPTDRDREATKAVGIIAHQANRREQVMDLKKMDVEELLDIVWLNGDRDNYSGIPTQDVAAELTRRITEANARADRLAAEAGAARKLIVALRDIIRDCSVVIPMKVSVAQKLEETVDEYEKCAIAINAAGDLEVKNAE